MMYLDDPMQPGPIYFLVQRRCGLFGVHAEGISSQMNYLIDEAASTGKGANCTISYLQHYLAHIVIVEKEMHLHADNCAGQNKNSYMIWYLAWRVLSGLHTIISIHVMLAGHTKFAPDWCFGLIKRKLRRTRVSCLTDIVDVVNTSSMANRAQLVCDETGNVLVPTFDWSTFRYIGFKKSRGSKGCSISPSLLTSLVWCWWGSSGTAPPLRWSCCKGSCHMGCHQQFCLLDWPVTDRLTCSVPILSVLFPLLWIRLLRRVIVQAGREHWSWGAGKARSSPPRSHQGAGDMLHK